MESTNNYALIAVEGNELPTDVKFGIGYGKYKNYAVITYINVEDLVELDKFYPLPISFEIAKGLSALGSIDATEKNALLSEQETISYECIRDTDVPYILDAEMFIKKMELRKRIAKLNDSSDILAEAFKKIKFLELAMVKLYDDVALALPIEMNRTILEANEVNIKQAYIKSVAREIEIDTLVTEYIGNLTSTTDYTKYIITTINDAMLP